MYNEEMKQLRKDIETLEKRKLEILTTGTLDQMFLVTNKIVELQKQLMILWEK